MASVESYEAGHEEFTITSDPSRIDAEAAHAFLSRSYWAEAIPLEVVRRAIAGSLAFAVLRGDEQVGFARVITDRATFAYLADVYILEPWRGRGLAHRLLEAIQAHPELQGLRRWMLATRDAHGLYAAHGFTPVREPGRWMEIARAGMYKGEL